MTTDATRRELYPPIEPNHTGFLEVGSGHKLYYEECGNPHGKPVVFLHGGPGGGCAAKMRRFWNPDVYRIILFDQRGSGKSTPHASLEDNTTWDLVNDIEILRAALQVEKWQVFGGSWGSTLALAYSQTHPQHVTEIILRGVFMLRKKEIDWFLPARRERDLSGSLGGVSQADTEGRARRFAVGFPQTADERGFWRQNRGSESLVSLGRYDQHVAAECRYCCRYCRR